MSDTKPKNYLNNKSLLEEIAISKKQGQMTNKLATMLQLLVKRFASRGNYSGYTYVEDMKAYAMLVFVKVWDRFDETKYTNAFAYYTTCVYNSFNQYLNKEKKQRDVRDEILLKKGLDASQSYMDAHRNDPYDPETQKIVHR